MFTQTNEEFYNDMYNEGNDNDVEEYILQNFKNKNNKRMEEEPKTAAEKELEYMEFEEIIKDNPIPHALREKISIPVPRGTQEVTKSRLVHIRDDLARRSLAVRKEAEEVSTITSMLSTNLEELEFAERKLEDMRKLMEQQKREYEEQIKIYQAELEAVNKRENFYRNELQTSQDAHRADAIFWERQQNRMQEELKNVKVEFEREKMNFMGEYKAVQRHLEIIRDTLEREREQNEAELANWRVALDEERQRTQRDLKERDEIIKEMDARMVVQDQKLREQEAEIIDNEKTIHDLHTQMYEIGEEMNVNQGTKYVEEGSSFMLRNWLQISGYRYDIGDAREILWNAASKTALGRHYRDKHLEESYWVNWVKSNLVDQLALKYGILQRKGVGYKGYVMHPTRTDVISGKTAYNTIMQYNDIMVRVLNATQKVIQNQNLSRQDVDAIHKASKIYHDPATQTDNIPTLLKQVKTTYEAYLSKTLPIEDNFRALMYFVCNIHKSKSKSNQV